MLQELVDKIKKDAINNSIPDYEKRFEKFKNELESLIVTLLEEYPNLTLVYPAVITVDYSGEEIKCYVCEGRQMRKILARKVDYSPISLSATAKNGYINYFVKKAMDMGFFDNKGQLPFSLYDPDSSVLFDYIRL